MMAQLLRQLSRPSSQSQQNSQPDTRSVEAVFEAAAERFGIAREPAVVDALSASGVEHAQLLTEMSEGDWDRLGASLALKLAVKAELAEPSQLPTIVKHDLTDKRIRQFLLLPGEDGAEAKPLSSFSSWFLALTATPAADRQNLLLALCELTALVSGLFLPISLEFRRHSAFAATEKGWLVPPTVSDGMDALAAFCFMLNAWIAFFAVLLALVVAAVGWQADDHFCQGIVGVLGALLFVGFMHMVVWPLLILTAWQTFTDAASPFPLIGAFVLFYAAYMWFGSMMFTIMIDCMPLEIYHMPHWLKVDLRHSMPHLRKKLSDELLRPAAELRAAKLRAQMGIPDRSRVISSPTHSPTRAGRE